MFISWNPGFTIYQVFDLEESVGVMESIPFKVFIKIRDSKFKLPIALPATELTAY